MGNSGAFVRAQSSLTAIATSDAEPTWPLQRRRQGDFLGSAVQTGFWQSTRTPVLAMCLAPSVLCETLSMAFSFEKDVLPVLLPLVDAGGEYELSALIQSQVPHLNVAERERVFDLLVESGYVTGIDATSLDGKQLIEVRIAVAGLQQLDLWPADNERAIYLAKRLSDAFEHMADDLASARDADPEAIFRLRAMAKGMLQFGSAVFAQVLATKITG